MSFYTEDNLVQKTTVEYLVNSLDWNESVYAMQEVFGAAGTLGSTDEGEVLLVRYLRPAFEKLNPGLSTTAYDGATVPLYYDARGEKLNVATQDINEKIAEKLAEFEAEDVDVAEKLESELKREYHVITAERLVEASRIIGIQILDHLILGTPSSEGGRGFVSLRKKGLIGGWA